MELEDLPPGLQPPVLIHQEAVTEDDVTSSACLMRAVEVLSKWYGDALSGDKFWAHSELTAGTPKVVAEGTEGVHLFEIPGDALMSGDVGRQLPPAVDLTEPDLMTLLECAVRRAVMCEAKSAFGHDLCGTHLLRLVASTYPGSLDEAGHEHILNYAHGTIVHYLGEGHPSLALAEEYIRRMLVPGE
jgi:hypothetical protein